jgi:hypothetical protein
VPYLARLDADPDAGAARREAAAVPGWIGVLGIAIGPVLGLCSLEFVGGQERSGWALAGGLVPIAYVAWSRWLMATGVALLVWALNSRAARPARARPGSGRAAP